jgi:hypothetical protein
MYQYWKIAGGGGGGTTRGPWDLTSIAQTNETTGEIESYLVSVLPGTLNHILPVNWNTDEGGKNVECQKDVLYYAKAVVETDGYIITNLNILIDTTPVDLQNQQPQAWAVQDNIQYVFGLFYNGLTYRTIRQGNIIVSPRIWMTISNEEPTPPGELPYKIYYVLQ